jgi:hypothetical protein
MTTKLQLAIGAAAGMAIATANALPITGGVAFAGLAILDNQTSALATQVSIPFASSALALGDFSPAVGLGTPISFTSPLVFGVTDGLIWSGGAGPWSFTAGAPVIALAGPNNTLSIEATGIVDDGPGGLDPTPAFFSLAITPTAQGIGGFGSITVSQSIPDSGTTLMGLGAGLVGLATLRMRRNPAA